MTKKNAFRDLLSNPVYVKVLVDFLKGNLSVEEFRQTSVFNTVFELSEQPEVECEQLDDRYWSQNFIEAVESRDKKKIVQSIRQFCHHEDFADWHDSLLPIFADEDFIEAVNRDKTYIADMKKAFKDLIDKNAGYAKFINIGWFDEPWMNGNSEQLFALFDRCLEFCDSLIQKEKSGNFHLKDDHDVFAGLESGRDASWDEWVHIFPNTMEYSFNFSLADKLKKHEKDTALIVTLMYNR